MGLFDGLDSLFKGIRMGRAMAKPIQPYARAAGEALGRKMFGGGEADSREVKTSPVVHRPVHQAPPSNLNMDSRHHYFGTAVANARGLTGYLPVRDANAMMEEADQACIEMTARACQRGEFPRDFVLGIGHPIDAMVNSIMRQGLLGQRWLYQLTFYEGYQQSIISSPAMKGFEVYLRENCMTLEVQQGARVITCAGMPLRPAVISVRFTEGVMVMP